MPQVIYVNPVHPFLCKNPSLCVRFGLFTCHYRELKVTVGGQLGESWDLRQDSYGEGLCVALSYCSRLSGNLQTHTHTLI